MAESANLELINTESKPVLEPVLESVLEPVLEPTQEAVLESTQEPVLEPVLEPTQEPVLEPVLESVLEPVLESTQEPVLEPTQEPVLEPVNQLITPVKSDTDTISYIKCVGELIVKEKISYNILGVSGEIIFSGLGFYSQPCIYIVILLKTSGLYTFEIDNQIVNKQGSGLIEFYVIKNISILATNIYTLKYTSTEPLAIYELNFADICLCHSNDCF
jgi:hypothetical protein